MKNFNNFVDIDKISSQLERAEIEKKRLIDNIFKEYELYLNLLRDSIHISVEKGLNYLFSHLSNKDNLLNGNQFFCFFEKKISKVIYTNLPLFTVEQLRINEIEKKISKEINLNLIEISTKTKNDLKEKFQYKEGFQFEEPIQFQVSKDNSKTSEYYQADNYEKLVSLDLDNNVHNNYLSSNNFIKNIGLDKKFISSIIKLIDEISNEKTSNSEKNNINQIDLSTKYPTLEIFDLIDSSLENLLMNLSYQINQELFKADLIKKIISKDSYEYFVGKNLMIKHPTPYVINFEFNLNQSFSNDDSLRIITLFCISTVELEFKNLNLSIQRNKLNELKNKFQRLIKKETYWRQKEISLNKIR